MHSKMEKGIFDVDYHLVGYLDASHAPLRTTGREEFQVECFQYAGSYLNLSQDTNNGFH